MSTNGSNPSKKDAKKIAKKFHKEGVVIFHFNKNEFGYATYGNDDKYCALMKQFAEVIYNKLIVNNRNYKRKV